MKGERIRGWVIMNHIGAVWTPYVWGKQHEAQAYLDRVRHNYTDNIPNHKVSRATAVVYPTKE